MRRKCRRMPPRVSAPDVHHGTCVTHVPWCMLVSLTSGFLWLSRWGKRSRHSRRMRNLQFYVSDKRLMDKSESRTHRRAGLAFERLTSTGYFSKKKTATADQWLCFSMSSLGFYMGILDHAWNRYGRWLACQVVSYIFNQCIWLLIHNMLLDFLTLLSNNMIWDIKFED